MNAGCPAASHDLGSRAEEIKPLAWSKTHVSASMELLISSMGFGEVFLTIYIKMDHSSKSLPTLGI